MGGQQPDIGRAKRQLRIGPGVVALFFVVIFAVVVLFYVVNGNDDDTAPETTTTTTKPSESNLPTDQDMIQACHDSIARRLYANQELDASWETAHVGPSEPSYYEVTGTGTGTAVGGAFLVPFSFTCTVHLGPPLAVVDNGYELNP